ncbi:MAG: DUF3604 domain-containing protein [Proteobacteria bacterium]|nr:DUF3604 domain-containing protein [Pseudomonadota bacterium]
MAILTGQGLHREVGFRDHTDPVFQFLSFSPPQARM